MINVFLILKTKLRRQHEQARRAPPLLLLAIPAISQYNFQFFGHWLLGKEISYAKTDTLAVELTSYILRGGCLFSSPFFGPFLQQEDKRRSRGRRRKTKTRKRKEIHWHCVWKSHKKSHSTSRVNILSEKNGPFWRIFENLKLAVKQCYQTGQF